MASFVRGEAVRLKGQHTQVCQTDREIKTQADRQTDRREDRQTDSGGPVKGGALP